MKRVIAFTLVVAGLSLLVGCAAKALRAGAERIVVGHHLPKNCKFRGQVMGEQGGALTGGWTSNKNLAKGSMNEIRNQALDKGANYVQILTKEAGNTMSGSGFGFSGGQTDVTTMGNAYLCPPKSIGIAE